MTFHVFMDGAGMVATTYQTTLWVVTFIYYLLLLFSVNMCSTTSPYMLISIN